MPWNSMYPVWIQVLFVQFFSTFCADARALRSICGGARANNNEMSGITLKRKLLILFWWRKIKKKRMFLATIGVEPISTALNAAVLSVVLRNLCCFVLFTWMICIDVIFPKTSHKYETKPKWAQFSPRINMILLIHNRLDDWLKSDTSGSLAIASARQK